MKKVLFALSACILICMLAFSVSAETYTGTCGAEGDNLIWTLDTETGVLEITGTGDMVDYTEYNYDESPWFDYRASIVTVSIGSGVTGIGDYAFYWCYALTTATISDSVMHIGDSALSRCISLTMITVSENNPVYSNDEYGVLFNKAKTELIQYPGGSINAEYIIPDSVTSIGVRAFAYCTTITSIVVPDGLVSIGDYAFANCTGLQNTVDNLIYIRTADNPYFYLQRSADTSLTSYTLNENTRFIAPYAFSFCYALTSLTIPDNVKNIGEFAFYYCSSLEMITVDENNMMYSNDDYGVLFNKDQTTLIQYPVANTRTEYIIPNSVTRIGASAFEGNETLETITIGDGVESIGDCAFCSCGALVTMTIPDTVKSLGNSVFENCMALTSVKIGNGVESIGTSVFYKSDALQSVVFGDSVVSIGESAFHGCIALEMITVSANNTRYASDEYGVLFNKTKTLLIQYPIGNAREEYTIPDSVISIDENAFSDCRSLTSVIIPDSITCISDWAFGYCDSLSTVTFGDSIISIGAYAFCGCSSLTAIKIPQSVTSIGSDAFAEGSQDFTIYGYSGSYAETYATENSIPFVVLEEECDHTFGAWIVRTAATTETVGEKYRVCSICEAEDTAVIPVLAVGDIDGDGTIGVSDVLNVLNALLSGMSIDNADMNGDGKVSLADVLRMLKAIAA